MTVLNAAQQARNTRKPMMNAHERRIPRPCRPAVAEGRYSIELAIGILGGGQSSRGAEPTLGSA